MDVLVALSEHVAVLGHELIVAMPAGELREANRAMMHNVLDAIRKHMDDTGAM